MGYNFQRPSGPSRALAAGPSRVFMKDVASTQHCLLTKQDRSNHAGKTTHFIKIKKRERKNRPGP